MHSQLDIGPAALFSTGNAKPWDFQAEIGKRILSLPKHHSNFYISLGGSEVAFNVVATVFSLENKFPSPT